MIKVAFYNNNDSRELKMTVKGHAGQADVGHDIICASASILAYTVAQVLKAMHSHGDLTEEPKIRLNSGDAVVSCRVKEDNNYAEALHTFFVAQVGYSLLAHNYPNFVELKMFGEAIKP